MRHWLLACCVTGSTAFAQTVVEDYASGTGLTSSFLAFEGTPAEGPFEADGEFWVGDVAGLIDELDNPFYNDKAMLPDGTPVFAFGPGSLVPTVELEFGDLVTDLEFTIYDVEVAGTLRFFGRDADGRVVYDSGPFGDPNDAAGFPYAQSFAPPILSLEVMTTLNDGIMFGPIQATLGCTADCNGDGVLNILDFVCFQTLFTKADPGADCDGNGALNILDFVCFQQQFQEGCD